MMIPNKPDTLIRCPSPDSFNTGLESPGAAWMLGVFGRPGPLTDDCSEIAPAYAKLCVTQNVGPFRVAGNRAAVLSLRHVFEHVNASPHAELLDAVKTDGMLCCRKIRGASVYSNHSWGTAIDLYFGAGPPEYGSDFTQQGLLDLYWFFHTAGWYSGMGYRTAGRKDAMHFEASVSLIQTWRRLGLT
jgi:D-alanyl-D-alanine carboxypeptidase